MRRNRAIIKFIEVVLTALTLVLCLIPITSNPVAAQDLGDYFSISYEVGINKTEVQGSELFYVTINATATCDTDLGVTINQAVITSRVIAKHQVSGDEVILNANYSTTIEPFPSKQGEISQVSQSVPLQFPDESQYGTYDVVGELIEAKLEIPVLPDPWLIVTELLPSSQTMGSVMHVSGYVDISFQLQGDSRPDSGWTVPATARFFAPGANVLTDNASSEFHFLTTRLDTEATGNLTGIMPGTYDITVVSEHTLMNVRRGVMVTASPTSVDMGILLEGNADSDIIIDIHDFGILAASFMRLAGDANFDPRADFDRNGIINTSDFGLLAVNFLKTSPILLTG
ncbi:hypothetical protein ACFLTZ_06815 [Chloroflexota bacterium]